MLEEKEQPLRTDSLPEVSVIIATYNRSYVLVHAIQSVLNSTFQDFEILVVGDCCTDDTELRVAGFSDPRIRFENLSVNHGDQSEPNNLGAKLARGKYLAFLNHDDLFLPDHLRLSLAELKTTGADLVWTACSELRPSSGAAQGTERWDFEINSVPGKAGYSPFVFCCASSWVMPKETFDRVGNWKPWSDCHVTPSQEWLFRAWKQGVHVHFIPRVSVVLIPGGARPGSYTSRRSPEHEAVMNALRQEPHFTARMLESAAIHAACEMTHKLHERPLRLIARLLTRPLHQLLIRLGIHPVSFNAWIRFGGRGAMLRRHLRTVGLRAKDRNHRD